VQFLPNQSNAPSNEGAAYTEPCLLLAIGFVNWIHVRTSRSYVRCHLARAVCHLNPPSCCLSFGKPAFSHSALVRFVGALNAIFMFPDAWELFGLFCEGVSPKIAGKNRRTLSHEEICL
jgi:hypothetical protein